MIHERAKAEAFSFLAVLIPEPALNDTGRQGVALGPGAAGLAENIRTRHAQTHVMTGTKTVVGRLL